MNVRIWGTIKRVSFPVDFNLGVRTIAASVTGGNRQNNFHLSRLPALSMRTPIALYAFAPAKRCTAFAPPRLQAQRSLLHPVQRHQTLPLQLSICAVLRRVRRWMLFCCAYPYFTIPPCACQMIWKASAKNAGNIHIFNKTKMLGVTMIVMRINVQRFLNLKHSTVIQVR